MDAKGQAVRDFLYAKEDKFAILQIKERLEDGERGYRFMGLDMLKAQGKFENVVKPENYEVKYMADIADFPDLKSCRSDVTGMLARMFYKFNEERPEDFEGRSLAVGDIILLHRDGCNGAYYVDNSGYTHLSSFLLALYRDKGPARAWYLGDTDKHMYFVIWAVNIETAKEKALKRIEEIGCEDMKDPEFDIAEEFTEDKYEGVLCFS